MLLIISFTSYSQNVATSPQATVLIQDTVAKQGTSLTLDQVKQALVTEKENVKVQKQKLKLQKQRSKVALIEAKIETEINSSETIISKEMEEKVLLKNKTILYKTRIWSTNFSVPLVRFNLVNSDDTKEGDVLLFNSIGAGIGYYWGRLERTRDSDGEIVNEEFSNTIGINAGALFSAGTGDDVKNVFAPVINLSALDFQAGVGYELGTMAKGQNRLFLTLSYAIPLYKLTKKGYRISKNYLRMIEVTHTTKVEQELLAP